jgi:hypothetical protein
MFGVAAATGGPTSPRCDKCGLIKVFVEVRTKSPRQNNYYGEEAYFFLKRETNGGSSAD